MQDNYTSFIAHRSGLKFYPYTHIVTEGLRTASGDVVRGENREATVPGPVVPQLQSVPPIRCSYY